jgi:hypothetical protein
LPIGARLLQVQAQQLLQSKFLQLQVVAQVATQFMVHTMAQVQQQVAQQRQLQHCK